MDPVQVAVEAHEKLSDLRIVEADGRLQVAVECTPRWPC